MKIITFTIGIFKLKSNNAINFMDDISFYNYIAHYMFFVGPFRVMGLFNCLIFNMFITIFVSFVSAVILKNVSDVVLKRLEMLKK